MLKFHALKVKARDDIAEDAVRVMFEVPEALREAYRFQPGQHVAVRLPMGDRDVRRTYSIACPADSADLCIGVRVQPGGEVSCFLAKQLAVGQSLDVLTPNGSFHTRVDPQQAKCYVAFAAGSGITPVLSIASTALAVEPKSRFMLFYGNRTTSSTMFLDEVLALKNRFAARFSVHFVMSREPQDVELFNGRLDAARVREFARVFFDVATVDEFFICGPDTMVSDVEAALRSLGTLASIHTELFTTNDRLAVLPGQTEKRRGRSVSAQPSATTRVCVLMDGRRRTFTMSLDGEETVLQAAARAGVDLPYSCLAGVCSTCRSRVVDGSVRMERNQALEQWEIDAGYVLCCQSRPLTSELELTYDE